MDKFVIRTARNAQPKLKAKSTPEKKQATIESLQGVVVVEDIKRHKARLKLPDQTPEILLESLRELAKKIPPRQVLKSTKIGHTVHKLQQHPNETVAKEARALYKKWRRFFEEFQDRPQIEVKCDAKSEGVRNSGRKFLADALGVEASDPLVDSIERETLHQSSRLSGVHYRRTMRAIVFKLKHSEDIRSQVLNRTLTVEELVKQFRK